MISGILTTYIIMKTTKGVYKNFNLFLFIISRYIRLTPGAFFSTISFFFLPYLGSGPFFKEVVRAEIDNCRSHWLANLIYLQTNIPDEDPSSICNIPVWWIAVEMKLHILCSFIVVCLFFNRRLSFLLSIIIIFFSILWAFYDHFLNNYPPYLVSTIPEVE